MANAQLDNDRVWRGMTKAELDRAYNNSDAVADSQARLAEWTERSIKFRSGHRHHLDLRYGDRERNRLDLFHCGNLDAPLLVFIHGGYWQRNSKEMFSCLSAGPLSAGFDVAMIGYTLCPEITLSALVAEIGHALDWLGTKALELGIGSGPLIVSGWSAGAHLAALMTERNDVSAGLLISGVYDLEPCSLNYLNTKLMLSRDDAERLSPISRIPDNRRPITVTFGTQELPELRRQSTEYAAAWGERAAILPLASNHFSILTELERPNGALVSALENLHARLTGD